MLDFPLIFREIAREKVWGGKRMTEFLDKKFPADARIGESWEISDVEGEASVVRFGPMKGRTLRELHRDYSEELLGAELAARYPDHFPLLIKILDTSEALSVQVHPSDEDIARLGIDGAGKMEAWHVLHAEPGATMVHGLAQGVTREKFERLLSEGRVEESLRCFLVKRGDTIFCPPGTVHAIGAGVTLYEIQQTSDTTYRLFDWDRPQDPENPRELHIEESLAVMNFHRQPAMRQRPELIDDGDPSRESLVSCDMFDIERWRFSSEQKIEDFDGTMEILCITAGRGKIAAGGESIKVGQGSTVLIPAAAKSWQASPRGGLEMLHVTIPAIQND